MKRWTIIYLGILCGFLFALPRNGHGQATGAVEGVITATETGRALAGVNVYVASTMRGTTTDVRGRYRLTGIQAGRHVLVAQRIGLAAARKEITVAAGQVLTADFALSVSAVELDGILVKGESLNPANRVATATVLTAADIQRERPSNPLDVVEQVAGVKLTDYRQGGTADAFVIRGFGGAGHGSDAAVQIDGIPLNESEGHDDGYADLNVIVPLELQRMTIHKGPSSALYGNFARGGTLAMDTRKGGQYRDVLLSGEAFGTFDGQLAAGHGFSLGRTGTPLQVNLAGQFFRTDGYAVNSDYWKGTAAGRLSYAVTDRTDVSLSLRGHAGEWNAPGYIPREQFLDPERRREQGPNAENDGGDKRFFSQRLDVGHSLAPDLRLLAFGYAVQQDFTRFQKSGGYSLGGGRERSTPRDVFGLGSSLSGRRGVAGVPINGIAGVELFSENTLRQVWATSNRVRTATLEEGDYQIQSRSAFAQAEIELSPYFRPTLGLRYDGFSGTLDNRNPGGTPTNTELNDFSHLSPKLGVRSTILSGLDLRASASNGYALPDGAAKYDPAIQVEPVEIWQYEIGATFSPRGWLTLDVVGFLLDTSKEILQTAPGSGVFENLGATRRRGIEAEGTLVLPAGLDVRGTLAVIDTEILENPNADLIGFRVRGIPRHTATLGLGYTAPFGLGGLVRWRSVGPHALTADNSLSYEGYTVTDLTLSYGLSRWAAGGRVFVDVFNLFDANYAQSVGYAAGTRTYSIAPAPPRYLRVGVLLGL